MWGRALHRYDMISDGDRILVGLSGGKDSLTLMWILSERLSRIPINYELFAVYIDPGFKDGFSESLSEYCRKTGFKLKVEYTDYGILSHSSQNRENPCFLCSRLRRKRLFEIADEIGCNKLALGHNKDDIIEDPVFEYMLCWRDKYYGSFPVFFQGKVHIDKTPGIC